MQRERLIQNAAVVIAIACAFLFTSTPVALADSHGKGDAEPENSAEHKKADAAKQPAKITAKLAAKTPPGQWHTVKAQPLKVQTATNAIIEALESAPVKIKTKQWTALKVVEAVAQGKRVEKGQVLIRLDTEKIDDAIKDAALALHSAELSFDRATVELESLEVTTPLDLAAAEEKYRRTDEDMDRYLKTDRPYNFKSNDQYLENAMYSLLSTQEELNQLRKMYEEDDLTEETEEIILKRQIHSVKRAELSYESSKNRHEQILNSTYPRQLEDRKLSMQRSELDLKRSRHSLPVALQLKKIDHRKQAIALEKSKRKLEELKSDKKLLTVRSPADGIVYYGAYNDGKWAGAAQTQTALQPDGQLKANTTILTIVQPRPVRLRATIKEADLYKVTKNMPAVAIPTASPVNSYAARIESVATLPTTPGQYTVYAEIDLPQKAERILPGMTAKLTITAQDLPSAITVPTSAVHRERPGQPYVKLLTGNNKITNRLVQLGVTAGANTHIRAGLKAGDKIQLATKAPTAQKAPVKK